jgi:hypothetical protein
MAEARPTILAGVRDHSCAHRVEVDITTATKKVRLGIDQTCFVSSLPERAAAPMTRIDVLDETSAQMLHHARETRSGCTRACKQMHVVRHEHLRVNRAAILFRGSLQAIQIKAVILIREKSGLPVIPPLDDVLWDACDLQSRSAWHTALPSRSLVCPYNAPPRESYSDPICLPSRNTVRQTTDASKLRYDFVRDLGRAGSQRLSGDLATLVGGFRRVEVIFRFRRDLNRAV